MLTVVGRWCSTQYVHKADFLLSRTVVLLQRPCCPNYRRAVPLAMALPRRRYCCTLSAQAAKVSTPAAA